MKTSSSAETEIVAKLLSGLGVDGSCAERDVYLSMWIAISRSANCCSFVSPAAMLVARRRTAATSSVPSGNAAASFASRSTAYPSRETCVRRRLFLRCRARPEEEENEEPESSDPVEGLERTVEKMLLQSPAVKSAIARVAAASERYEETLKKKQAIEFQEQLDRLEESRALAHAEAEAAKKRIRAEELRLLAATEEQDLLKELARENAERLQSVKAFTLSSISGVAGLMPILLVESGNPECDVLNILATALSSGLYGITYRYAVGDGQNIQLKFGAIGAFWITSTLSYAQSVWSTIDQPLSNFDIHLWNRIGLQSVQFLIIFLACTLAMEASMRSGFIRYATDT